MDETPALALPYILPAQAQKHVTHNEALDILDATVQLAIDGVLNDPPAAADDGATYGIGDAPVDGWADHPGALARRRDGVWQFVQPRHGWIAWDRAQQRLLIHDGLAWSPFGIVGSVPRLGVGTGADDTNRLAVGAPSSLFTHAGDDHRMKINKASAANTASLLFQSNWSGRAEMGLAGTDGFSLRVSPDGASWSDALTVSASGFVATPARPVAHVHLDAASYAPSDGGRTGFDSWTVLAGGFELGPTTDLVAGQRLLVPETGLYLLVLSVVATTSAAFGISILRNGSVTLASIGTSAAQTIGRKSTIATLAVLDAGDWIVLDHEGTAGLSFGADATSLGIAAFG
ncbi:DUF2793 domain-containing protein [Rhizobium sp. TRM95111]|uniref:DUF2793 domain-containing protein n=1 Tax=Rhizobium alarense TaxID=2846851 RepID=UPI001F16EF3C|nr:DUF2793 domain-containing protein [Rhizobium alarense]MCF3640948.1 DUF2793 domain-containing protein [Rhizobium alarense]